MKSKRMLMKCHYECYSINIRLQIIQKIPPKSIFSEFKTCVLVI